MQCKSTLTTFKLHEREEGNLIPLRQQVRRNAKLGNLRPLRQPVLIRSPINFELREGVWLTRKGTSITINFQALE